MHRKLLVTGGAGFIGSNFIHYWLEQFPDDAIINLDLLTYAGNVSNLASIESDSRYTFVQGDIRDPKIVTDLMVGVTTVVHFAAETHVDRSVLDPSSFVTTNVLGTQVLLEAARTHEVAHFHHISTDEVFGSLKLQETTQFTEDSPYDPRSPYSASKAGSDHLVRAYGETYGLPYTISNCSNNYGPYQFPEKLIPLAITNLLENKRVPVYGAGNQVRDWLYVVDHCRAVADIITAGPTQKTYLIGGLRQDVSNLSVIQLLLSLMNISEEMIEFVPDRPGHDVRYSVDWSGIHTTLGWEPSVQLAEGLTQTIRWYRENEAIWKPLKARAQKFFTKNYDQRT